MVKETRSTCPYCGVGCGVIIQSTGAQITGVRGDPQHPANFGRLCSKGSTLHLSATAEVTQQTRLLHPQQRAARGGLGLQRGLLQEALAHDLRVEEHLPPQLHLVEGPDERVGKIPERTAVDEPRQDQVGHHLLHPVLGGLHVLGELRDLAPAAGQRQRAGRVEGDVIEELQCARQVELVFRALEPG